MNPSSAALPEPPAKRQRQGVGDGTAVGGDAAELSKPSRHAATGSHEPRATATTQGSHQQPTDSLDHIPDPPFHLMRVRGIPQWANQ